jgi:acetate---CoA ligase (ADP-forming)
VRGHAAIEDVPDAVDLAVICVPAAAVLEAARSALAKGVRALLVISAGFAEVGAEGAARERELLALVRAHGARLIGPNCLGIASAATRLNATFASRQAPAGNIGFSSQSGALGLALLGRPSRAASDCRPSSRSATRPTSRRTTCSSGGRTTPRPK